MLIHEFVEAGHVNRFTVTRGDASTPGWEVVEERDDRLIARRHYTDWHRVERALQVFDRPSDAAARG
jgi:hypothetical protein